MQNPAEMDETSETWYKSRLWHTKLGLKRWQPSTFQHLVVGPCAKLHDTSSKPIRNIFKFESR
jgi:hypothetical protein